MKKLQKAIKQKTTSNLPKKMFENLIQENYNKTITDQSKRIKRPTKRHKSIKTYKQNIQTPDKKKQPNIK